MKSLAELFPNCSESTRKANPHLYGSMENDLSLGRGPTDKNDSTVILEPRRGKRGVMNKETYESKLARNRAWYQRNREQRLETVRNYRNRNHALINERSRTRSKRRDVMDRRNFRQRQRYAWEISRKIYTALRTRMNAVVKCKAKQKSAFRIVNVLGCSILDFKIYIESRFEPGMTWDNYGSGWHLDHVVPCAIFNFSNQDHVKRCFHFSNYQPLWAEDNLKKGARIR